MTRRRSPRSLLQGLTALLLCIGIAAACGLGRSLATARPGRVLGAPEATGTGLDRDIDHLHAVDASLEQIVDDLSRRMGQPIRVDWDKINADWAQTRQAALTVDLDDISLASALQTVFGRISAFEPVHITVSHGVVMVSSRPLPWDVVVCTYDVSGLVQRHSDRPVSSNAPPVSLPAPPPTLSGLFGGAAPRVYIYTTGRIGPFPAAPTPRDEAMQTLTQLAYDTLLQGRVEGTTTPTVTQWSDRLIVVATEPQQRHLQQFLAALRLARAAWDHVPIGGT